MTVRELITVLSAFDPDTQVVVEGAEEGEKILFLDIVSVEPCEDVNGGQTFIGIFLEDVYDEDETYIDLGFSDN